MNRSRFRWFAALLALIAFSTSVAEAAWASTCAPAGTTASAVAQAPGAGAGDAECPPASGSERDRTDGPRCPFAVVTGACVAPASLPVVASLDVSLSFNGAAPLVSADHARHLLFSTAFFRPPRA
jgi:hypothetical protein